MSDTKAGDDMAMSASVADALRKAILSGDKDELYEVLKEEASGVEGLDVSSPEALSRTFGEQTEQLFKSLMAPQHRSELS